MSGPDLDAVVVGSGPNGLAAALVLAASGRSVQVLETQPTLGGGARTLPLTLPGYRHDICSAVHPMAVASPFFRALDLERRGVELLQPDVAFAEPLDGGRAGVAWRDLDRTVEGLGADGPAWRAVVGTLAEHWEGVVNFTLGDLRSVPRDVPTAVRTGLRVLEQGSRAWNVRFAEDVAPALLTGVSAHAILPPRALAPAAAGLMLACLAHAVGWPIPRGGSDALVDVVVDLLGAHGVELRTDAPVASLAELPAARVVLLDTSARGVLELCGPRLPDAYRAQLERFEVGHAAAKVDFALSGPVPWAAEHLDLAGTLHLGGTREEILATEREVAAGRLPQRPYVLASQPSILDDTRAPAGHGVLWTYAHVPTGCDADVGEAVTAQVERFAPGFRDVVEHRSVIPASRMAEHNQNYVDGDIAAGAPTIWQMVGRPVLRADPYEVPLREGEGPAKAYLCSASAPPGPGVHGMCGVHASRRALRRVFHDRRDPLELLRAIP